jgi:hypothetical protein
MPTISNPQRRHERRAAVVGLRRLLEGVRSNVRSGSVKRPGVLFLSGVAVVGEKVSATGGWQCGIVSVADIYVVVVRCVHHAFEPAHKSSRDKT